MSATAPSNITIHTYPSLSLPTLPFSPPLHKTIITSFKRTNSATFPPAWTRLNPDPETGIRLLTVELGPQGHIAVLFDGDQPVGCGGFLPFRGGSFINASNARAARAQKQLDASTSEPTEALSNPLSSPEPEPQEPADWELCCVCLAPTHQGRGLSILLLQTIKTAIRARGGKRLFSHYSIEANEYYWPKMGFENVEGGESVLRKGFTHTAGMEGLRADLRFRLGVKVL